MDRHFLKNDSGVAAVEFALIAPVFLLLCVGILDFGMFISGKMRVESTAHAIADYVLSSGSQENVMDDVVLPQYDMTREEYEADESRFSFSGNYICKCADGVVVSCGESDACADIGDESIWRYYDVSLTHRHATFMPYQFIPDTIEVTGTAQLRMD